MVFLNFNTTCGAYTYGSGVNAANLTSQHIKDANAKLDPFRQQRIASGLLKATSNDHAYKSLTAKNTTTTTPGPDYENWTKKELAKALVDRRIKLHSATLKINKNRVIASLRKADKDPSFDHFTSLPAELRNQIYGLTLADDKPRVRPVSPAISRVSSQLRKETLPIFLRDTTQTIVVNTVPLKKSMPQLRQNNNNNNIKLGELPKEYGRYFDHAAEMGWIQHMRRFQFRVERHSFDRKTRVSKHWHERHFVKFARNMSSAQTWVREKKEGDDVEERVRAAMAGIASRPRAHMGQRDLKSMLSYFVTSANTAF